MEPSSSDEAVRRLAADPGRELGPALLDQRNLAGVGNLYSCEVCFLSGLSPWTRIGDVPDLGAVVDRAARLLQANKDTVRQVTTGDLRRGLANWVFERSGQPCLRCGTRVAMAEQGEPPRQRLTYWCPRCQPGPAPRPTQNAPPHPR